MPKHIREAWPSVITIEIGINKRKREEEEKRAIKQTNIYLKMMGRRKW
jgi:hypothetical protein